MGSQIVQAFATINATSLDDLFGYLKIEEPMPDMILDKAFSADQRVSLLWRDVLRGSNSGLFLILTSNVSLELKMQLTKKTVPSTHLYV